MDLSLVGVQDDDPVALFGHLQIAGLDRSDVVDICSLVENGTDLCYRAPAAGLVDGLGYRLVLDECWKDLRRDHSNDGQYDADEQQADERNAALPGSWLHRHKSPLVGKIDLN